MGLIDLLKGRKETSSENIDFSTAKNIIDEAGSKGVTDFDVTLSLGPRADKMHRDYKDVREILKEFGPHDFSTKDGEWVYKQELEGSHKRYSKENKDVHYIYLRNILYGGKYRSKDGGKKPHRTNHYVKIKFEMPKKSSALDGKAFASMALIGLISSIFFFSPNLTGNVIGSRTTSNIMGAILFLLRIIGAFFYLRKY